MSYLDVAARLYRYSFTDALLIHAQRPDATACAELELWNQKMSRWVNRGAKGIALLDDTGPRTRLRYVFDIADTHLVRGGRTPLLWNLNSHEHEQAILDHLADTYGLSQTDSMNAALLELAQQLTADNLDEAMDGLTYEVADTFLEELDEDNIRVRFRELMTNSIFYALSRRCGQEPMDVLDDDDFIRIVDFNKLPVLSFLGNAVSEQCEAVLFDIGREMRKIYKKEITQQLEKSVDSLYNTNTDFSTLKHETKENTTKGGQENGVDVLPQGRLSVPESGREGRAADHREVRDAAQDVPEREPQELVSEYADERQAEPASGADRGSSGEPGGNPAGQPERKVSGSEQGERPAGMGSAPEQSDGDGRRDRLEGIGVQLTETTTEQDLSEAEEEIASAFSFPDLPTVEQQIRAIEAPIQARYADEIALDSEVVDEILRTGSNRSKGQLRLIYNFMVEKTPEEYTEFVKNEYGTGGKGFEIDGAKYAVWFDDLGLRIAVGSTAKGGTIANAFLSWEDVSNRINDAEKNREYRCRSYAYQIEHGFMITTDNYEISYCAKASQGLFPAKIRENMESLNPDKFKIRKFGVSDVIAITAAGKTAFYYVDKESLVKFNGFLAPKAEGSYLILNEGGYQIEGQTDTWKVIDEKNVQEQRFVQLVCEQTKKQRPDIILHDSGVLVAQTIYGFDSSVMKKIEKFLREQKPELLHYQKFLENGTAERAKESGTEQNYNMIDGCVNNNPKKPRIIGNRISVLDRLHIKLEERKQKSQPQQQQQQERSRKN